MAIVEFDILLLAEKHSGLLIATVLPIPVSVAQRVRDRELIFQTEGGKLLHILYLQRK